MNAVYVIIYHTQEEYAQYQIPVTAVPAEIINKLYRCNGTVVNCSDDAMKVVNVKTKSDSLVNYDLERMVESVEGANSKVALTLVGPMTQQEVYKALMNVEYLEELRRNELLRRERAKLNEKLAILDEELGCNKAIIQNHIFEHEIGG